MNEVPRSSPRSRFGKALRTVSIIGTGSYVPEKVLTNADLSRMVDTSDEWITERTGIKERRILKGEGLGTSHMAAEAVRGLLERTATRPQDVDLLSVVGFAVFLAVIIVLGRAVGEAFGATGAVAGAIFVGLVDVDAVTVSMVRLTPDTLSRTQAVFAILAAVASDTVSKIAIGAAIGRGWFAADLAVLACGCLALGGAAAWLTFAYLAP